VQNLQSQLFSILGSAIFAFGLWLVKRYWLQVSWRKIVLITTLLMGSVDSVFVFSTIYNVVRNQYFYLGETILVTVPGAAKFMVTTFLVVEMADDGKEGMVYGLLTTMHNLGNPVARAIGNQLYGYSFSPALTNAKNYEEDSPGFRDTVAASFVLSYAFGIIALFFLVLMPAQKDQVKYWKANWGSKRVYAKTTVVMVSLAWVRVAGGEGC
jgi:hypothetical protein